MRNYEGQVRMPGWVAMLGSISMFTSFLIVGVVSWPALKTYLTGSDGVHYAEGQQIFWVLISLIIMHVSLIVFFFRPPLKVKINRHGVSYYCFPYLRKWKLIQWNEIENWEVVEIDPISDFGGWGYRRSWKGKKKGYIMRAGPALSITKKQNGTTMVFTIPNSSGAQRAMSEYLSNRE